MKATATFALLSWNKPADITLLLLQLLFNWPITWLLLQLNKFVFFLFIDLIILEKMHSIKSGYFAMASQFKNSRPSLFIFSVTIRKAYFQFYLYTWYLCNSDWLICLISKLKFPEFVFILLVCFPCVLSFTLKKRGLIVCSGPFAVLRFLFFHSVSVICTDVWLLNATIITGLQSICVISWECALQQYDPWPPRQLAKQVTITAFAVTSKMYAMKRKAQHE